MKKQPHFSTNWALLSLEMLVLNGAKAEHANKVMHANLPLIEVKEFDKTAKGALYRLH